MKMGDDKKSSENSSRMENIKVFIRVKPEKDKKS